MSKVSLFHLYRWYIIHQSWMAKNLNKYIWSLNEITFFYWNIYHLNMSIHFLMAENWQISIHFYTFLWFEHCFTTLRRYYYIFVFMPLDTLVSGGSNISWEWEMENSNNAKVKSLTTAVMWFRFLCWVARPKVVLQSQVRSPSGGAENFGLKWLVDDIRTQSSLSLKIRHPIFLWFITWA